MNFPSIYKIIHKGTQKYYVGSSVNPSRRWKDHKRYLRGNKHANDYLQRAWNKYGEAEFDFVIVASFSLSISEQDLLKEEQQWLEIAKTDPFTYNLTFVAGSPNSAMSDYSKRKRSESLRKVIRTPEWKRKISKAHMGMKPSDETREKLRKSHLGKKQSQEQIERATDTRRKNWCFLSPSGKCEYIYDLKRFCRENGLHSGNMYHVASGKRSNHRGWMKYA